MIKNETLLSKWECTNGNSDFAIDLVVYPLLRAQTQHVYGELCELGIALTVMLQ